MAYIGKSPDGTGVRSRFYYTQTSGGGTSVTGSSDDGTTLAFSDGAYVDVFLNGVLLVAGTDYNTTTANTIAGLAALANGDVVEVVVYDIFTVADTVSSLNGGAFSGAVTVPQLNADNLRLDGNTISSTDTNGDITLDPNGTGSVAITGGFTATDGCTITTADNSATLTLTSTDADGSSGPHLIMLRDSSTPADNDLLGQILFQADDSGGNQQEFAQIQVTARDVTDGTEDGQVDVKTLVAGSVRSRMVMNEVETTFNQDSQDIDFRVESDNDANAFFVRGSDGSTGVGLNNPSGQFHVSSADSEIVNFIEATKSDYTGEILYIQTTRQANTTHRYIKCNENNGATVSFQVLGNGNTQNINNSFTATSDERIKKDITDANSQWEDIKALKVKNFKLKYRVSVDGDNAPKHIGVVAQDLEAAGMHGLVENIEPDPYQKDTLGIEEDVKSVKYSILYMKAVKALQEAITRIEALETKVAALEAGS